MWEEETMMSGTALESCDVLQKKQLVTVRFYLSGHA